MPPPTAPQDKYRLPTNLRPLHYDLTFWTDLKSAEFGGFAVVHLEVVQETSSIMLNCSEDLTLTNAWIQSAALGDSFQSVQIAEKDLDRVNLKLLGTLPTGSKAQLKIHYAAKLRGSMDGYFKSAWKRDGQIEYYALTHFQPIAARAAFPCWDEPLPKATFSVSMISRVGTVNLSNMPSTYEEILDPSSALDADLANLTAVLLGHSDAQWKITKFKKTPLMSSYLVAFANGPFAYLEKSAMMPLSGRQVPVRIYATPDLIYQAEFALDVVATVLPLYEKIFDIEYPLPKLDVLAADDFDIGAMENWGLIMGRKAGIIVDPQKPDIAARKLIARVQSHEVAHQWFGNITTMAAVVGYVIFKRRVREPGVCLSQSSFVRGFTEHRGLIEMGEAIVLDKVFPEWEVNSTFILNRLGYALKFDAKRSSHPIEVECPDANFINQIFDALSYSKAASVLRMLSQYVGEDRFLHGVSLYLKNRLYANSVTSDLWDGVSAATGLDIDRFMDNWITKTGFPLITVTENAEGITVRQDRFLDSGVPEAAENETLWNVPLALLTVDVAGKAHIDKGAVLEAREKTFSIDTSKTFKLNAGTVGFYRVLYTAERLSKIAAEAAKESSVFSLDDKLGLIDDVAELSRTGLAPTSSFLALVDTWRNETNYMVWVSVLSNVGTLLDTFCEHPQISDSLRAFLRMLFVPLVERLGYEFPEGETVDIVQLRKTAISGAAAGRDPSVTRKLQSIFAEYMETGDDSKIPMNIKHTVFSAAARFGSKKEFDVMLKMVEDPTKPALKNTACHNIGCTEDPALIEELFAYMLTKARDQDVVGFCLGLKTSLVGRRMLGDFFKDNYDAFSKRFATNMALKHLVINCFGELTTQADHDSMEEFFKDKDTSRYSMALAQTLETIRVRAAYIERSTPDLLDWLAKWEQRSKA